MRLAPDVVVVAGSTATAKAGRSASRRTRMQKHDRGITPDNVETGPARATLAVGRKGMIATRGSAASGVISLDERQLEARR